MDYYLKPEDSQLLDRLVDGELNDAERRELLFRLERTPDGWRRCALAFLEGQAWRSESKSWTAGGPEVVVRPTPVRIANRNLSGTAWFRPLATAACVLFALGAWIVVKDRDGNIVRQIHVPDGGAVTVVSKPTKPIATNARTPSVPVNSSPTNSSNMRLVVNGGPNEADEVVEVPLVDAERLDEALFGPWSQSVPPEVMQFLEREGHQVVRERRLVPVDLRDGRRVVVPMDQIEILPVSSRGYQ